MGFSRLILAASTGTVGCCLGVFYERFKNSEMGVIRAATSLPPVVTRTEKEIGLDSENASATKIGLTTANPNRASQIMRFGFPGYDNIRALDDYVLSYDRRNRTANWVFEHMTRESLQHHDIVDRTKCNFIEDTAIHPYFRSSNDDYKGSGFDRGHLAAAGNHRICQKHCEQTFLLSNMAPQVGKGFNRDAWNKLEKHARHLTKYYKDVYVCTGPLYLPRREADGKMYVKYQVIGRNNVAVPTHFFKVIVAETDKRELELEAYVMPNAVIEPNFSLKSFQVPAETIERHAGFLIFDKIPKEKFKRINGFHKKAE